MIRLSQKVNMLHGLKERRAVKIASQEVFLKVYLKGFLCVEK